MAKKIGISNEMTKIFEEYFKKYKDILDIIDSQKDIDNMSRISQKEIANTLGISQTLVSKCIVRLERSDKCIEKIKAGVYKVNHTDTIKYGPFNKFLKYITSIMKDNNIIKLRDDEQAEILNMTCDEIKMVRGYAQILLTDSNK
ncbi:MAG: winged helix-turn-helix transcriptional regulator [Clostridium sp.]|uniref:winged helix-turn-helix transcriptional regulator n=1 Tax=Clostridium sp. TaxID=1506 RepID=UPI0025B8BED6|nr:winged helix-turn-helix transcriptional regulator [Clostridium sp.]MCE5221186.1 winged helix-turn-helix transcriptional regulator [Clostridium sp.]